MARKQLFSSPTQRPKDSRRENKRSDSNKSSDVCPAFELQRIYRGFAEALLTDGEAAVDADESTGVRTLLRSALSDLNQQSSAHDSDHESEMRRIYEGIANSDPSLTGALGLASESGAEAVRKLLQKSILSAPVPVPCRNTVHEGSRERLAVFSFNAEYVRLLSERDVSTEAHFCQYFGDLIKYKAGARLRAGSDVADDVRQETLMRVLKTIRKGRIEHPERLGAFVNAVCNNVMLEFFRRSRRINPLVERQRTASHEPSLEEHLLRSERVALVRRALEEISPQDQELLRRIFLEEQDKEEVCREFQVSREYLRILLYRSRRKFSAVLSKTSAAFV